MNLSSAKQQVSSIQAPVSTPSKGKKKSLKKTSSKLKANQSKKVRSIFPNGKTLSTESCSSGIGAGKEKETDEIGKKEEKKQRRNSKRSDDLLKKSDRDSSNILEHKTSHLSLLGKRFKIEDELLGFGSFGRTYLGKDIKKQKNVAIKIMLRKKSMDSFLREATVLKSVNYIKASGFPQMLMSAYNEDICILVEELLGINLETLRKKYSKLSFATMASIGIQLLNRLESLHRCGFIHRDIKPQNILLGRDGSYELANKLHLIDFGLSIEYLDEGGQHYRQAPHSYNTVVGTALFASVNAHQGLDLSRRDDIESMVYTLIYLCSGTLPWKNINIKKKKERHQIIMLLKEDIVNNQQYVSNSAVPIELYQMLQSCTQLKFEEEPDYKYLKSLLQKIIKRNYSNIKKMKDIDILSNNFEDTREKHAQITENLKQASPTVIDVSSIAFQFGFNQNFGEGDNLNSVASNEQLVFRSELDGKSNNMNTLDRDELSNKVTPSMYRQLFGGQQEECGRFGQLIAEIPEEEDESGSEQEDEEEDEEDDGNSQSKSHSNFENQNDDQEGNVDEGDDMGNDDIGDEDDDIPDDFEICPQIQGYFLNAKDNHLTDKKGHKAQ